MGKTEITGENLFHNERETFTEIILHQILFIHSKHENVVLCATFTFFWKKKYEKVLELKLEYIKYIIILICG